MKPLLFLSQRIPFPPNKGDKLRSFSILRHLAESWEIHLGCFIDDPADWQYVEALRPYCADFCCLGLDKRRAKLRSLPAFLTGQSLSERYFQDARMSRWVNGVLGGVRPDAAFLFSSVMGQYLPQGHPNRPPRVIMDFVDVDSDKWRLYAERHGWPMNWVYGRESRRLLAHDRRVAAGADAGVLISEPEAALFRRLAPEVADRIEVIANGIDLDYFSPDRSYDDPFPPAVRPIVFTGAMDYWPNIDAAQWFAEELFPAVRAKIPQAAFWVVGGNPAPRVTALAALDGVTVTGRVPDVRPYLAHAAVAVAPMRVARGIQNKVLEGMAMGRTVVTTRQGLEGIDARPGQDLLLADDGPSIVKAVVTALVGEIADYGPAARRCVVGQYSWRDKLAAFDRLLQGA